jgi:VIT1/CCC1 family predicted Fe2+/Mn2+ transporter
LAVKGKNDMVWAKSPGVTGYPQVVIYLRWNSLCEGSKDMHMKESVKKGFGFGLTSGVITTLGMMVGLSASTGSRTAVIGGIIAIAIADAFSDAVGMHISEEAENHHSTKEVWEATFSTLLSKFLFALTFLVPILVFQLATAIFVSVCWGVSLVIIFSWHLANLQGGKIYRVVLEHVAIVGLVIFITHYVGGWVRTFSQ